MRQRVRPWSWLGAVAILTAVTSLWATPLDDGINHLIRFNFKDAYTSFAKAREQAAPGSDEWAHATFGMAVSAHHTSPPAAHLLEQAATLYQDVADKAPKSGYAPRAILFLGRLREMRDYEGDKVDLEGARACYQRLIDEQPGTELADEALLRMAGTYTQLYDQPESIRKGVELLEDWLAKRPDNRLASAMWEVLGEVYFTQLDDDTKALDAWLAADRKGLLLNVTAQTLYWRIAVVAERHKRYGVAIEYYRKIIIEQPQSGRAYDAQMALAKLQKEHPDLKIEIPRIQLFDALKEATK